MTSPTIPDNCPSESIITEFVLYLQGLNSDLRKPTDFCAVLLLTSSSFVFIFENKSVNGFKLGFVAAVFAILAMFFTEDIPVPAAFQAFVRIFSCIIESKLFILQDYLVLKDN